MAVPAVLLSGDHAAIVAWRRREALRATLLKRPDLLHAAALDAGARRLVAELAAEEGVADPLAR
jgi:tRNA (guanine37-N1)-methyltransferase